MPLDHNLVKTWFVSRAKPFATHFFQWIDACWFKGEKIPVADIEGLDTYLGGVIPPVDLAFTANTVYTLPAGYAIYQMYVKSQLNMSVPTLRFGSFAGGDDLVLDTAISAITPITVVIPALTDKAIYIREVGGSDFSLTVRMYLHKI